MMRHARLALLATLTALACALPAWAQKHPNIELGFNAKRVYDFSQIDSVNLYNGNLILQIPIGPTYSVNALKYQLVLTYNSKVWDYVRYGASPTPQLPNPWDYAYTYPNWRSNAGVGWRLSLGRLLAPAEGYSAYNDSRHWHYEDASGAEHVFDDPQ